MVMGSRFLHVRVDYRMRGVAAVLDTFAENPNQVVKTAELKGALGMFVK